MQNNNIPVLTENENEAGFDIRAQLDKYLVHWKWFTVSIIVCLFLAFIYLRYSTPEYSISATILIKDEKKGGAANELSAISELSCMSGNSNVDNEIEVLKARTLVQNTVKSLKFNVSYFNKGNLKTSEAYKNSFVRVNFYDTTADFFETDTIFLVKPISGLKYELLDSEGEKAGVYSYGESLPTKFGNMVVTINTDSLPTNTKDEEKEVLIQIKPLRKVTDAYRSKIQVNTVNKMTSVVSLSITDKVPEKGKNFLDTLISIYNNDAVKDKNLVATNTEEFINKRLESLTKELDTVERDAEGYKRGERLTDIVSDVKLSLTSADLYSKSVND